MTLRELLDKATPGEWSAVDHGSKIEVSSIEYHVCEIDTSYDDVFDRGQCDADARLIALAPVLAALLNDMAEWMQHIQWGSVGHCPFCFGSASKGHDNDCPLAALLARYGSLGEEEA